MARPLAAGQDLKPWERLAPVETSSGLASETAPDAGWMPSRKRSVRRSGGLRLTVATSGMGTCVGRCGASTNGLPDLASRERILAAKLLPERHALATAALGLHNEHAAEAARYAGFDATLEARADGAWRLSYEGPIPDAVAAREQRLLLLERLAFLRDRERGRRVCSVTFELS